MEAQPGIEPMSTVLQTPSFFYAAGIKWLFCEGIMEAQTGIEPMSTVLQTAA